MLSRLLRYLRPEITIRSAEELREGPAVVHGTAARCEAPLVSPFRRVRCIAYSYAAYNMTQTRAGSLPSPIRQTRVHAPFVLALADGTEIEAIPSRPGKPITDEEHNALQRSGGGQVVVREEPITTGQRVQVEGMVVQRHGRWQVRFGLIEVHGSASGEAAQSGGARGGRKRRRRR